MKTQYRCVNCHAEDSDSGNLPHAPAIICWSCKAGRGMSIQEQINNGVGMFVIHGNELRAPEPTPGREQRNGGEMRD